MASVGNPLTILLVDDDEALRRFVRRILKQQGFHVIEASDGAEALEVASEYSGPVDLLLTDVIMPNVNGLVLAQRLLQERPGIRVLYVSGYVEGSMLLAKHPESILLQKPFTPDALIAAMRQVLGSARAGPPDLKRVMAVGMFCAFPVPSPGLVPQPISQALRFGIGRHNPRCFG